MNEYIPNITYTLDTPQYYTQHSPPLTQHSFTLEHPTCGGGAQAVGVLFAKYQASEMNTTGNPVTLLQITQYDVHSWVLSSNAPPWLPP